MRQLHILTLKMSRYWRGFSVPESKTVEVQYYAILREQAGTPTESVDTEADSASNLYQELAERHKFSLPLQLLKVAINDQFVAWNTKLQDQDIVVFIPPVAGG